MGHFKRSLRKTGHFNNRSLRKMSEIDHFENRSLRNECFRNGRFQNGSFPKWLNSINYQINSQAPVLSRKVFSAKTLSDRSEIVINVFLVAVKQVKNWNFHYYFAENPVKNLFQFFERCVLPIKGVFFTVLRHLPRRGSGSRKTFPRAGPLRVKKKILNIFAIKAAAYLFLQIASLETVALL